MLFKNLPFQLFLTVACGAFLGPFLPNALASFFYTAGFLFKDVLMCVVPFVVCGYLMASIVSFDKKSVLLVFGIVLLASISGFFTSLLGFGFTKSLLSFIHLPDLSSITPTGQTASLRLMWTMPFASPFTPTVAIFTALVLGFMAVFCNIKPLKKMALSLRDGSTHVLKQYVIPFLPLYVLAIVLQMRAEGSFKILFSGYGKVFLALYTFVTLFLLIGFWILGRLQNMPFGKTLKTYWSTVVTAFTTMSGIASLPFLIEATEKASGAPESARFTLPLTVNIHTLGDGLAIPISALALIYMQDGALPSFMQYLSFAGYYTLARFFSACVPGGGALIMAPFAQQCLGLNETLTGLFTTLYVLQDPFITTTNSMGNALFALATKPFVMWGLPDTKATSQNAKRKIA